MATHSFARVDRSWDELLDRLTIDARELPVVVEDAMMSAAEKGVQVMEARFMAAVTRTGLERKAAGEGLAGRIETGALVKTLRTPGGQPATVTQHGTRTGRVVMTFGYQQVLPYTRGQEYNDYSISGQLLAQQIGFNYFVSHVFEDIADGWRDLDKQAQAGKFNRRASYYRGQGLRGVDAGRSYR